VISIIVLIWNDRRSYNLSNKKAMIRFIRKINYGKKCRIKQCLSVFKSIHLLSSLPINTEEAVENTVMKNRECHRGVIAFYGGVILDPVTVENEAFFLL